MIIIFAGLQHNAHRHTLHNLYIIAGSIFRRKQTESRTRGAPEGVDVAPVVAPASVRANGYGLPGIHLLQLRFFEIRGDPEIIYRNDGEQLLTRLHTLAGFNGFATDDSAHR